MEPGESKTAINETSEKTEHSVLEGSNDVQSSDVTEMRKVEEGNDLK